MRTLGVIGLAVALAVTACGGGKGKANTVAQSPTSAQEQSGSHAGALRSKLLTVGDLPTGYSPSTSTTSATGSDTSDPGQFCQELANYEKQYKAPEKAEVEFQKGEASLMGGAVLVESIQRYGSSSAAKTAVGAFAAAVTKCTSFDTKDASGSTFKGSFQPLSFAKIGQDTFAAHLSGEGGSAGLTLPIGGDFVVVREGEILALVASFGFGAVTIQPNELEQIVRSADKKL